MANLQQIPKYRKFFLVVPVVALVMTAVGVPLHGQGIPVDGRTFFTFSGPVAMPGVGLAPGRYLQDA